MRNLGKVVACAIAILWVPSASFGQASITGVVRDASGAVLPGVTAEAASPALIEKGRVVVTDAAGQYRIENLRPGVYSVTFTLPGFSTVRREGVELTGTFTATINAELQVGALEETITVTGETPTVDIQNTTRQRVLDHEVIDAIPAGRSEKTLGLLIPGISYGTSTNVAVSQDVGGTSNLAPANMSLHGGRPTDQRVSVNGISFGTGTSTSNSLGLTNLSAYQEVTIDTAAVSADQISGGVRINFVSKDGGNRFNATMVAAFANESMQGSNFTSDLKDAGLRSPDELKRNWDFNPGVGGPILRDRLWFYTAYRHTKSEMYPADVFANRNANNPAAWTYDPDLSSKPFNQLDQWDAQLRLTWQVHPKLKIGMVGQNDEYCGCPETMQASIAPEATTMRETSKQITRLADWSAPVTNRLLIDGTFLQKNYDIVGSLPPNTTPEMIPVTEQALGNLLYRSVASASEIRTTWYWVLRIRSAVSYITGAHALRAGFDVDKLRLTESRGFNAQVLSYRFNNAIPNQITLSGLPLRYQHNSPHDFGMFVQDKWTVGRLTASAGLRYDYHSLEFPAQTAGPTPLLPNRNLSFEAQEGVSWHDITPKSGVAFDLFGTGKTALKASLNKYPEVQSTAGPFGSALNPMLRISTQTTRSWADADRDFVPDCDLVFVEANGECGALADRNFGLQRASATYDPATLTGWGVRAFNWEFSAGIQHEVMPRVAVDVSYFRRWFGNFTVTDNRATTAADYTAFSVVAPSSDPRLPTAGQTISGYYDLNPNKVGQVDNYITSASNYGKQTEHWNGVDITVSARPASLLLQGGVSTGRTSLNTCEVRGKLPEMAPTNPFCDNTEPFRTQVKFLASYTIPRVDVQVSGTVQTVPGPVVDANFVASNALVAPSLGRPLSGNAANVTLSLIPPNSLTVGRINQLDVRVAKLVRFGAARATVNFDIYNALNSNSVLGALSTFGGARPWQTPTSILQARLFKLSAQFDF